ncbi:hypothetical protein AB1282_00345 [Gottfriedia sp. S16(2024)]|uniref:hypothetical protein n=1 Tax=Gottfriedia sp. S16(2024) TaxID=3162883 RepID=UPI003D2054DF
MTNKLAQLEKEVAYDFKKGGPLVWEPAKERPKQADLVYVNGKEFNYKMNIHGEIPLEQILVVTAEERKVRVNEILAEDERVDINRLSDILLYDKLYNSSLYKMEDEEYPIMSDRQFDRRESKEVNSINDMDGNASDGRFHGKPTRRERTEYENRFIDKRAKIRNIERKKAYQKFTEIQPVITWTIDPLEK